MSVARNIPLIYMIGALMWMRFFIPVMALFYVASQVPLEQFTIIMAVFALATLVFEIPSGAMADLLGRKRTLILSRACYIVEIALLAFANGFWPLLVAKAISGVGVSLQSGTNDALLYDTLKRLRREREFARVRGTLTSITQASMAVVFIIGGVLFSIDAKLPAKVSLPLVSLGLLLTFLLREPYTPTHRLTLARAWEQMREGVALAARSTVVKAIALYSVPIAAALSMALSLSSAYLEEVAVPVGLIGAIAFTGSLLSAAAAKGAHRIEARLGERGSLHLLSFTALVGLSLMAMLVPWWGVLFLFLVYVVGGPLEVVVADYMNQHVRASHRATMLSVRNMGDNVAITLLFPVAGYAGALAAPGLSYAVLAAIVAGGSVAFILYRARHKVVLRAPT